MTVVAAAVVRAGRVLVMRRAPGQRMAGKWEFPGGKVEPGEDDKSALERELSEELGISGKTGALIGENLYEYPAGSVLLRLYDFDWRFGDILLTVHDALDWVVPEALGTVDFSPADVPLAAALRGRIKTRGEGARIPDSQTHG